MASILHDLTNICRLCLGEDEATLIPTSSIFESALSTQDVERFTGIQFGEVTEETIAYAICIECENKLKKSVVFRAACLANDVLFKQLYPVSYESAGKDTGSPAEENLEYSKPEVLRSEIVFTEYSVLHIKDSLDANTHDVDNDEDDVNSDSSNELHLEYLPNSAVEDESEQFDDLPPEKQSLETVISTPENSPKRDLGKENKRRITRAVSRATNKSKSPEVHTGSSPAGGHYKRCDTCGKMVSDLRSHILTHTQEKNYECPHCPAKMSLKSNLNIHIKSVHLKQVSKICTICNQGFVNYNSYKHHMATQHGNGEFECASCSKKFTHIRTYRIHIRRHHGDEEIANQLKQKKKQLCGVCGAMVTQISTHILTHTQEKKFACPHCPLKMTDRTNLGRHIQSVHLKNDIKSCEICGKGFKYNSSYRSHMLAQHGIGKTFDCDVCSKKFNHLHGLKAHVARLHSTDTNFECSICSMRFKVKSSLTKHLRVHTHEQPYACNQCPRTYKSRHGRNAHQLTHSGVVFKCPHCEKFYRHKDVLATHIRNTHVDPKTDVTVTSEGDVSSNV